MDDINEMAKKSCFKYVVENDLDGMLLLYREETGDDYQPSAGINQMIDKLTGADKAFCQRFWQWFSDDWDKGALDNG